MKNLLFDTLTAPFTSKLIIMAKFYIHNSLTVLDQALSLLQRQTSLESLLQATIIDSSDDTLSPSRLEKCLLKHWSTKRLFWLRLTSIIFPQLLEAIRILFEDSNGIMYEISSCKTWTGVISVEGVNALPFDVPITKRPASENWNKNLDFIEVNSKACMIHQSSFLKESYLEVPNTLSM